MRKFGKLMLSGASTIVLGSMTGAERAKGRYMRAPDDHPSDGGFAEFEAAGDVEVGSTKDAIETNLPEEGEETPKPKPKAKPKAKTAPAAKPTPTPAPAPAEGEGDEGDPEDESDPAPAKGEEGDPEDEGEEGEEGEGDEQPKPKKTASDRIRELTRARREDRRLISQLSLRIDAFEKGGLPTPQTSGNTNPVPDPSDTEKYPLGHLDDRYIEDKLEWLAEDKAIRRADAGLQRQQEQEQTQQAEQAQRELLQKVDTLSDRGAQQYDDFQEAVVDAGMKGQWALSQPTFEAAHDAENGAQILYELSQDKDEAKRVAGLTPYQQLRYVADKDAEISKSKQPRRIPGAGAPPSTQTRGANSRVRPNASTDSLDEFEKAWAADAKGK